MFWVRGCLPTINSTLSTLNSKLYKSDISVRKQTQGSPYTKAANTTTLAPPAPPVMAPRRSHATAADDAGPKASGN